MTVAACNGKIASVIGGSKSLALPAGASSVCSLSCRVLRCCAMSRQTQVSTGGVALLRST